MLVTHQLLRSLVYAFLVYTLSLYNKVSVSHLDLLSPLVVTCSSSSDSSKLLTEQH